MMASTGLEEEEEAGLEEEAAGLEQEHLPGLSRRRRA